MRGFFHPILIIGIIILSILGVAYYKSQNQSTIKNTNKPLDVNKPNTSPSPSSETTTSLKVVVKLYSVKADNISLFDQLDLYSNKNFGFSDPLLIDSNLYLVEDAQINKYDLNNKSKKVIFTAPKGKQIINLSTDKTKSSLFITIKDDLDPYTEHPKYQLYELNLTGQKLRELKPMEVVTYGTLRYLAKSTQGDIVITQGGDGCGGYGTIYLYQNGSTKNLLKTGAGCVDDPRFLEVLEDQNSILLYSVIKDSYNGDGTLPDQLFIYNIGTEKTESIFDLKTIADRSSTISYNDASKKVIVNSKNKKYLINTLTRETTIENIPSIPFSDDYYWSYVKDNYQYGLSKHNSTFVALDKTTGKLTELSSSNEYGVPYTYIGEYNNALLFYKEDYVR